MKVVKSEGNIVQICYRAATNDTRQRFGDTSGNWSNWFRVYDSSILTDSTVLSPLASALGEISGRLAPYAFGNITDLNSIEIDKYGIYFNMIATATAPANLPSQMSNSNRFILICVYAGYDRCQIVVNRNTNAPYLRYGSGDSISSVTWSAWKEL